jgi:flagellar biosynthesis/type III secretory pathway protein FliH
MSSSPSGAFDFAQLTAPAPSERPPRLGEAVERARAVIAHAEVEAVRLRDHARAAGFGEGVAEGRAEAMAQLQPAVAALGAAVAGVNELNGRSADAIERQAVELAMKIAEKVVAGALTIEPERVLDVVRGALRAIVERERVVVQVNPADLELVRSSVAELSASLGGIEQLEVQEERRVARGGAIVRTGVGEVDARIAIKLDQARAAVESELGG